MKAAILLVALLLPRIAMADEGPWPPCAGQPLPAYSELGEPPRVQVWKDSDLRPVWQPAECVGWIGANPKMLVALAARFRSEGEVDAILARFAAVSTLSNVRYWSLTDGRWERLFIEAYALDGPDLASQRADFSVDEMKSGKNLYFVQQDNRSTNKVIYRMRLQEASADGMVVEMENITPVRFYIIELSPAGALRSLYFLNHRAFGVWDYYSLIEVGSSSSMLTRGFDKSYINRATALFRHFADIPTDRDAPAAP